MSKPSPEVTTDVLQAFADAWNRHDADALMSFMTEDCVFDASAGSEVCGTRHAGRQAVRAAYAEVWSTFPDAHWETRATWSRANAAFPSGRSRAQQRRARHPRRGQWLRRLLRFEVGITREEEGKTRDRNESPGVMAATCDGPASRSGATCSRFEVARWVRR